MDINWRDLIDKSLVVELHGEMHEVMVVRVSPNGTAVQFDFSARGDISKKKWVRADQCIVLDTLDEDS